MLIDVKIWWLEKGWYWFEVVVDDRRLFDCVMVKKEEALQRARLPLLIPFFGSWNLPLLITARNPRMQQGSNSKGGELSFTRPRSTRVPPTLRSAPRGYPTLPAIQVVVDIAGLANCMNGRSARLHVLRRILCG
jgi:hypothetical protein